MVLGWKWSGFFIEVFTITVLWVLKPLLQGATYRQGSFFHSET
jgi:hypothetical protein